MATCKVGGMPVKGAICGYIKGGTDECGAPIGHQCDHREPNRLREYHLITRSDDGSRNYIQLIARSFGEAYRLAGKPRLIGSKSKPWVQCGGDCGDCAGCSFKDQAI